MMNIKNFIANSWRRMERIDPKEHSNKIGSFMFFYKPNPQELGTVSRSNGKTRFTFGKGTNGKGDNGCWIYTLTDEQHEEFVDKLSKIEEFKDCIVVKGEVK